MCLCVLFSYDNFAGKNSEQKNCIFIVQCISDISDEEEIPNEHERESSRNAMPKLAVTSLVLPDNASRAVPSYSLPKRRLRVTARRFTGAPKAVSLLSATGSSLSDKDYKDGIM